MKRPGPRRFSSKTHSSLGEIRDIGSVVVSRGTLCLNLWVAEKSKFIFLHLKDDGALLPFSGSDRGKDTLKLEV